MFPCPFWESFILTAIILDTGTGPGEGALGAQVPSLQINDIHNIVLRIEYLLVDTYLIHSLISEVSSGTHGLFTKIFCSTLWWMTVWIYYTT